MWTFLSSFPLLFAAAFLLATSHAGWSFLLFLAGLTQMYNAYHRSLKVSPKGKGVLITGCDSGFGHRLAINLHELGFTVFACCLDDKSDGGLQLKNLGRITNRIRVVKMDVTNQEQVDEAREFVEKNLPESGLWGIVNNAGLGSVGFIEWVPMEVFEKVMAVNLFGAIRVTKAFAPLIRQSQGRIVNVSSTLGRAVTPFLAAYCITKFGMEAFSDILRYEMKRFNVTVCTVEPGNYMSATGITGKGGPSVMARQFWDQLSDSLQEAYGKQSLEDQIASGEIFMRMARTDISPVVDAMVACLHRQHPKTHYFQASFLDKSLAYMMQSVPASMTDPFVFFFQYRVLPLLGKLV